MWAGWSTEASPPHCEQTERHTAPQEDDPPVGASCGRQIHPTAGPGWQAVVWQTLAGMSALQPVKEPEVSWKFRSHFSSNIELLFAERAHL